MRFALWGRLNSVLPPLRTTPHNATARDHRSATDLIIIIITINRAVLTLVRLDKVDPPAGLSNPTASGSLSLDGGAAPGFKAAGFMARLA